VTTGIIALMARRSPARLLAPLALVGFVIALLVVINSSGGDGGSSGASDTRPAATTTSTPAKKKGAARRQRRTYVVKPGDTPSSIAEKVNVPLSQIQELNPELDDQTLNVGDRIKIRP
jgi:LysM repeat protein